jgi:hypothetical protein
VRTDIRLFLKRGLVIYLSIGVFLLGFAQNSIAVLIPSALPQAQAESVSQRDSELRKMQDLLESKLIAQRLSDLGFTAQEVQQRLAQLSDEQIHHLSQHLDSIQTGGDGLGIVIALLVIAILVVILLHITGHKVIVTK